MNRDSSVYACFIDASNAFDRVKYDKLFELLLGRGIPHVAVRLQLKDHMTSYPSLKVKFGCICKGFQITAL